jgi:hypothetical protein
MASKHSELLSGWIHLRVYVFTSKQNASQSIIHMEVNRIEGSIQALTKVPYACVVAASSCSGCLFVIFSISIERFSRIREKKTFFLSSDLIRPKSVVYFLSDFSILPGGILLCAPLPSFQFEKGFRVGTGFPQQSWPKTVFSRLKALCEFQKKFYACGLEQQSKGMKRFHAVTNSRL